MIVEILVYPDGSKVIQNRDGTVSEVTKFEMINVEVDWKATVKNVRQDYTPVEFDGITYWVR